MAKPPDCPICGVLITPDVDGKPTTPHDQEKHDRRKLEDQAAMINMIGRSDRIPKPGIWDPPGDKGLPAYVRSLIVKRPDLEATIIAEYEKGLRGELLKPETPQLPLPIPKREPHELRPPRRAYGQDDD